MDKETVEKILSETKHGYDMISKKFSQTRKHFWRGLEFIKDYTRENDSVLDYGCGNGRLLELIGDKDIDYLGVDVSQQLIEIAKMKYCQNSSICHPQLDWGSSLTPQSGEGLDSHFHGNDKNVCFQKINLSQNSLALPNEYFNTVYSIAVFHHLPGKDYRKDVAQQLCRTTKQRGHVVVTVWNLWQKKYRKNIFENWKNKLKGKSTLDWNDCHISFANNEGKKFNRFHHAFTKRELRKLFESAGFETEKCEIVDGRNILYIGKKG